MVSLEREATAAHPSTTCTPNQNSLALSPAAPLQVLTLTEGVTVEQAIDQMEAIGHDFFIFREAQSDTLQVGVAGVCACIGGVMGVHACIGVGE